MENKTLSFEELVSLGCREFDPKTTMSQIIFGVEGDPQKMIDFINWDINEPIGVVRNDDGEVIGMMLKFNHKNYTELLYITLNFLDYYNLYFIQDDTKEVLYSVEDVDCESLFPVIREVINNFQRVQLHLN